MNRTILLLTLFYSISTSFAQSFVDHGNTIEQWDILDWRGDAKVYPTTDHSCPPGFGLQVLHIEGGVVLSMAKGFRMSEGTFVALYHENEARDKDADGIIMVKSEYDPDISKAHNTKEKRPHVWLEQDNDCGVQLKSLTKEDKEENLAERCGFGVVTDSWNKTNWIWQKVTIKGNTIRAKTWPAHDAEPTSWSIEAEYKSAGERFGFKINSGNINLAYFAADKEDIPIKTPSFFLYAPVMRITRTNEIAFSLFTNVDKAAEKNLKISVKSNGKLMAESNKKLIIPSGNSAFRMLLFSGTANSVEADIAIELKNEPHEGSLQVLISDQNGNVLAERILKVLPVQRMRERFAERGEALKELNQVLTSANKDTEAYKAVKVIYEAAFAHLENAIALFDAGDLNDSEMSFRFVDEALGELAGYKKKFVYALNSEINIANSSWDKNDRRGVGAPKQGITDAYSMEYLLTFGAPVISAQSMVMGNSYDMTIPWQVEGNIPDKDYDFEIRVVSPLGHRVVAKSIEKPEVPTRLWKPGETYLQHVKLSICPEDPEMGNGQPEQPAILDEYHYILISVIDPATGAKLILGNAPGEQPERVGQSFSAGQIYISSTKLEIQDLKVKDGVVGSQRKDGFTIANVGSTKQEVGALFSMSTKSGKLIYQDYKPYSILPGNSVPVQFKWESHWSGELDLSIQLVKKGITFTEVKKEVRIGLPEGLKVAITKANHVENEAGKFCTPIHVACGNNSAEVKVYADGRLVGSAKDNHSIIVKAEPWFGYYDVIVNLGKYSYAERMIATVVETKGMDMVVNGEPFLIKGVNVHGLDGRSPENSETMMRIMRELGFNAWRGDYPPLWQMELAYELNSFYTVLGPFSCTSTDEIFARQVGPPMATARELSRLMVERYKNSAGVLLWNSSNEIVGENVDFLKALQPVYKVHDPYKRPVHYSNLYGQNLYQGQNAMGVNYYFGAGQSAEDRQPLIQRSIDIARTINMPIMFNEFNSYAGAVHSTGVEAMYGMYEWGIGQGMCGGFQYMKGNSTSHPGIFDGGYNTHKIYNEAIIDVLADAEVTLKHSIVKDGNITIQIRNKRWFTLRKIRLKLSASGNELETLNVSDIKSKSMQEVTVQLPENISGHAVTLDGYIEFVTHYGFKSKVPVAVIATY